MTGGVRRSVRGHTLAEMLIAMTVMSVVGAGITRLIVVQSRAFQKQDAFKAARSVTRAALNIMITDLRMVEASGGMLAASPTSVTVRVPYALGVMCSSGTISILPVDSLLYAQAAFSGYAWRDSSGAYQYVETGAAASAGTAANCTAAGITTLSGGRVINLTPALPASATVGTQVMLFQRIRYEYRASTLIPGRTGLWRTLIASGLSEELSAPFDSAQTKFRFYILNADSAQNTAPVLANVRGIELVLTGQSERVPPNQSNPANSTLTTAIFFGNRLN